MWSVGKQILGGLFALLIVFGVIRPIVKSLMARPAGAHADPGGARGAEVLPAGQTRQLTASGGDIAALPAAGTQPLLASSEVDPHIDQVKQFVAQDPKIAAQVIKGWVSAD